MTRSNRRRLTLAGVSAVAAVATGLLSACGAGQLAATSRIVAAIPGGSADLQVVQGDPAKGLISVRDAVVVYPTAGSYPKGSNAPLSLRLVNTTGAQVTLVGVTATILKAQPGQAPSQPIEVGQVSSATPSPSASPSTAPSASQSATPAGSASAKASASASTSTSAGPVTPSSPSAPAVPTQLSIQIPVAPNGPLVLDPSSGGDYLEMLSLPDTLSPGDRVSLVFMFRYTDPNANTVVTGQLGNPQSDSPGASPEAVVAPVEPPDAPLPRETISLSPTD